MADIAMFSSFPNMDTSSDKEHPFHSEIGHGLCLSPVVKSVKDPQNCGVMKIFWLRTG